MEEEIKEVKTTKKKVTDRYLVGEVPTEMAAVIKDSETEVVYNSLTMLCKIANDIEDIKKGILG